MYIILYGHSTNLCMQDAHQEVIISRKRKEEAKKRREELVCMMLNFRDNIIHFPEPNIIHFYYPLSLSLSLSLGETAREDTSEASQSSAARAWKQTVYRLL